MTQRTFVYGKFLWPGKEPERIGGPAAPDIAVEILREFGATELRGKLHFRPRNYTSWVPAQTDFLRSQTWYQAFERRPKLVVFDMDGSGPWEVLYFRNESDETGAYVAIALKLLREAPPWVSAVKRKTSAL